MYEISVIITIAIYKLSRDAGQLFIPD